MSTESAEWPPSEEAFDPELEAELDASDLLYADALKDLFRAPADLLDRTRTDVASALLDRSTALAGVDLLGTGWRVARVIFGPSPGAVTSDPQEELP